MKDTRNVDQLLAEWTSPSARSRCPPPSKWDKYEIAARVVAEKLDGFTGVLPAEVQRRVFGRNIFGKKRIKIDASNQGSVKGSFKVAFGTDFVTFDFPFDKIAKLANDPVSIIHF
jgi:hypothetical protein